MKTLTYSQSRAHYKETLDAQSQDSMILKRINALIKDIARNGHEGIGKPEPLRLGFHGYWSRRITGEHRLVYKFIATGGDVEVRIAACRYHYGN